MATRPCNTFPPPPLKFRTAGFPQYGFKPPRSTATFANRDHPAAYMRSMARLASDSSVPAQCRAGGRRRRTQRSRGPWLAGGLFCPARSWLTMASSEPLGPSRRLMFFDSESLPTGQDREGPQFTLRVRSVRAVFRTPADRSEGVTVGSPSVLAFAQCRGARHPQVRHASRFVRGLGFRGCKVRFMLRPGQLLALHRHRTFTFELSSPESPPGDVEYNYAGKQSIPAAGLAPAGHAALWAATRSPI